MSKRSVQTLHFSLQLTINIHSTAILQTSKRTVLIFHERRPGNEADKGNSDNTERDSSESDSSNGSLETDENSGHWQGPASGPLCKVRYNIASLG